MDIFLDYGMIALCILPAESFIFAYIVFSFPFEVNFLIPISDYQIYQKVPLQWLDQDSLFSVSFAPGLLIIL